MWAMPKSDVTRIKAVSDLLMDELANVYTVDPFHPKSVMGYAPDYLRVISDGTAESVLLRPPTTWAQAQHYVKAYGETWDGTTRWWANLKNEAARITMVGGLVISVGWDSNGLGKNRGFQLERILYVAHGGHWHDSIVTVERKVSAKVGDDGVNTVGLGKESFPTPEDPIF
jgi:hypothetical protein